MQGCGLSEGGVAAPPSTPCFAEPGKPGTQNLPTMAKTGIHIKRCNVGSVEAHNERKKNYLRKLQELGRQLYFFQDLTRLNKSWVNPMYAGKSVAQHFDDMCQRYLSMTGQAPQLKDRERLDKKTGKMKVIAGWSPIREGCPPIKPNTQLKDFAPFVKWLRSKNLDVIRIDLHHDEGHEDEEGQRIMNHHAHVVIDWTDHKTEKTVKLSKKDMEEMQTVLAESLGMERGAPKADTGREHVDHAEWRERKAEEHYQILQGKLDDMGAKAKEVADVIKEAKDYIAELEGEATRLEGVVRRNKEDADASADMAAEARKRRQGAEEDLAVIKSTYESVEAARKAVSGLKSLFGGDKERYAALVEELYQAKKDAREWETVARHMQHTEGQGDQIRRLKERNTDLERMLDKAAPGWRVAERMERARNTLHLDFSDVPSRSETQQQTSSRTRSNDQEQGIGRGRK